MTRKDYIALADGLAASRPRFGAEGGNLRQWLDDRDCISAVLQRDNPRFDRDRFDTATEA
jgi:hypothetical protein